MANDDLTFEYYRYHPSLAAAIIFTVLFFLLALLHIFQLLHKRTWYFTPVVVGSFMECLGYVGRIWSSKQTPNWTLGPYIIQSLFLLIAPALIAASIYMILGRIILAVDGEKHSLIRKRWLTKIFVATDIASFLVLSAGAGILSGSNSNPSSTAIGQNIILAGLFIQIAAFGGFIVVALLFHRRIIRNPTPLSMDPGKPWKKHLLVLYLVSLLIMIRSAVRVVEYIEGNDGFILSHEVFLYIFDGTMMLIAVAIFNVFHPSELIPGSKSYHERQVFLEAL